MTDRLREGIGRLLGEEWSSADVLDMLERDADEPPPEHEAPQSTRALAAALMRATAPGSAPDPDSDKEPDQPDNLTVTVAARLRRKDNRGRAHFGLLPHPTERN